MNACIQIPHDQAWTAPAEPLCEKHLPGVSMGLALHPQPKWPIELRNVRALHGALTVILGRGHGARIPYWSLYQSPASHSGWVVHWMHPDAGRLADQLVEAVLFRKPTYVRFSAAHRIKVPTVAPGPHVVKLTTVSPVCIGRSVGDEVRRKAYYSQPCESNLVRSFGGEWLQRVLDRRTTAPERSAFVDSLRCRIVLDRTRPSELSLGPKLGRIQGWEGELVLRVNAQMLWALCVSERLGLGARGAFGLGQVKVERLPC